MVSRIKTAPLLSAIPKKYFFIAGIFFVLSIYGAISYYGHLKYEDGKAAGEEKCEAQKQKVIDENIKIREDQDNIIRPDTDAYIKRLLDLTA